MSAYIESDAKFAVPPENAARSSPATESGHLTTVEKAGSTSFIDKSMLMKYLPTIQGPVYYLAGPQVMVAAMRGMLADSGADEDDIRTEEFCGY